MKPLICAGTVGTVGAILFVCQMAQAELDNEALTCGSESPTFFPRGDHWPMDPDVPNFAVTYQVQADGYENITSNQDLEAVRRAFATWMAATCAGGNPNIGVTEGALFQNSGRGDEYQCPGPYGGECGIDCESNTCDLLSVRNVVSFVHSGWENVADSQTTALTTTLSFADTGYIITADIEFNADQFGWRAAGEGCSAGTANCFDIESVALHEIGHFLGFNHVMCTDAVMFPKGSGIDEQTTLTAHEQTGLCTLYPPRDDTVDDRDTGEQCENTGQCPTDPEHICIKPLGHGAASSWGWCAKKCVNTEDCDKGYVCARADNAELFCKPGPNQTGGGAGGGDIVDPDTGYSLDLCNPCTEGPQCASGMCVSAGGDHGICTQSCVGGALPGEEVSTGSGCPPGMDCTATDQGFSVCWPDSDESCGQEGFRGALNELCYRENDISDTSDDWYRLCGPGLICFVFLPRCLPVGREGRCVTYCNATDTVCPDSNLQCCYGVDDRGQCIDVPEEQQHGGCFDLRSVGETCIYAEHSICEENAGCFHFEDQENSLSQCFNFCNDQTDCGEQDTCILLQDACNASFGLCCNSAAWEKGQCIPSKKSSVYDVGVACRVNADCDSNMCLKYDNQAACSRTCNAVTGVGCPGNIDVNGDGILDGGFDCVEDGFCWPKQGPVEPLVDLPTGAQTTGGCCSAVPMDHREFGLYLLILFGFSSFGRRRFDRSDSD